MKHFKTILLSAALLQGPWALADYACTDANTGSILTVKEHLIAHGGDTSMALTTPSGQKFFFGFAQSTAGTMQNKKVIAFDPASESNALTLVSGVHFCGRAGCPSDPSDPENPEPQMASGVLTIDGNQIFFDCHETAL